ncbi:hypothetical protein [Kitasatospora sp. NPDC090091]|uniref:hypothetical protein n=1 Tax=Kitasatospora sp. NPDC090091 TaxID=3364081 RepID=UPI0037FDD5AA
MVGVAVAVAGVPAAAETAGPGASRAESPQCEAWTGEEAASYLVGSGEFTTARGRVAKDTCLISVDQNRFAPGWYVGSRGGDWYKTKQDNPKAVYKQFVYGVVRREASGFEEGYVLDRDQLRDVAANRACDAKVTTDGAHAYRVDVRSYGRPDVGHTTFVESWNEVSGVTDLGSFWPKDQCLQLTHRATKWNGHTYYETTAGDGGGTIYYVDASDVELQPKTSPKEAGA